MKCPKCKADTKVKESLSDVDAVYRRRDCKECGYIFYTSEMWTGSSVVGIDPANELTRLRSIKYYNKKEKN